MSFYCLLWLWRQFTEISVLRTWNIFCQNLGDFLLVSNDTTIVFQNNTLIVESLLFPGWNIWSYCVPKLLFITKTYLWRYFSSTNISITSGKKLLKLCLLIKAFYNQWDHHQSVCSAEKLGVLINQVTKGNSLVLHCASLLFWKIVSYWMYFGQGQELKLNTKLSKKVQYFHNQATKNSLNEAILLMSINEALLSR